MDRVKIRYWDSNAKRMTPWEEAYKFMSDLLGAVCIFFSRDGKPDDAKIPMLYTGRSDKTGKEAYDGDIVQLPNENNAKYKIIWDASNSAFWMEDRDGHYYGWLNCMDDQETSIPIEQSVIIGNIYENPNLLK